MRYVLTSPRRAWGAKSTIPSRCIGSSASPLPIFPELAREQLQYVVDVIAEFHG
jgi:hypothetical protein